MMVLRNTCHCSAGVGWEGFLKPGQVRRPAIQCKVFKAFGKKSTESSTDSLLEFIPAALAK
jgi:hypothetical protein